MKKISLTLLALTLSSHVSLAQTSNCMVIPGAYGNVLGLNCFSNSEIQNGIDSNIPLYAGRPSGRFGPDLNDLQSQYESALRQEILREQLRELRGR